MANGDISSLAVQDDGAGITATVAGITGSYVTDPVKLAAAFVTKITTDADTNPVTVKIAIDRILATNVGGNASLVIELKPHPDNPSYSPLIRNSEIDGADAVTITWAAGTFSGTGGSVPALTGAAVANDTSLPFPKTIGGWSERIGKRISGTSTISVHMDHIEGVAAATLHRPGGSVYATITEPVFVPTAAWLLAKAVANGVKAPAGSYRWDFPVNAADFSDGEADLELSLIPKIADSASTRTSLINTDLMGDVYQLPVYFNHGGTLTQSIRYVSTTGNDTTGDGLTAGTAYATAQKAYDDLPTKTGGIIRLVAGTYTGSSLTITNIITGAEPVTIDGQNLGDAIYDAGTFVYLSAGVGGGHLLYKNMKIKVPTAASLETFIYALLNHSGENDLVLSFETFEVFADDLTTAGGLFYGPAFKAIYMREGYVHNVNGVAAYGTHVRDIVWHDIANAAYQGTPAIETSYGARLISADPTDANIHVDYWQLQNGNSRRADNVWSYDDRCDDTDPRHLTGIHNIGGEFTNVSILNHVGGVSGVAGSQSSISGYGHIVVRNFTSYNIGFTIWGAGADGSGIGVDNRSYRNGCVALIQYINVGDEPRCAHLNNWSLYDPVGFQGVQDDGSDFTTDDVDDCFVDAAGGDLRPGPALANRVPEDGALAVADVTGTRYADDGTDAIGGMNGQEVEATAPVNVVVIYHFIGGTAGV